MYFYQYANKCFVFFSGYSIFVIRGNLPECEADQLLQIMRVEQHHRPKLIGEDEAQNSGPRSLCGSKFMVEGRVNRDLFQVFAFGSGN